ncbi:MAG: endolytic transglycosylase MltG [Candidatus Aminicenantes bacterium]|nr:endolytic transglycosylase MltG [Candidatus Aminicenantes bacterium]
MKILFRPIKFLLILAQAGLLGFCVWIALESSLPAAKAGRPVLIEITRGQGASAIAAKLKAEGVLAKTTPFLWRYRMFYSGKPLKAGEYKLDAPSAPRAVIEALTQGRIYLHPVTVAEGLTGREAFPLFTAAGFGSETEFAAAFRTTASLGLLDPQAADLEGYLFPETYRLPKGMPAPAILAKMTEMFKEVFTEAWRRRASELGLSVRDAVILASLIEKETGKAEEKPLVSSVFHNRLRLGMRLDCDPTIVYVLKAAGTYKGRLYSKDLKLDSPYNTYLHAGLPPGPICNPGRESLRAALQPAATEYLFFVSRNDGSHQFSRSLREHNAAVDLYQR